jgi:hypothetical protein
MKSTAAAAILLSLLLQACWFDSTKATVEVVEHQADASGRYYALLFRVVQPKDLAGRYGVAATLRRDLIEQVDNRQYEVSLNFTMVDALTINKPTSYSTSEPSPGSGDFLDSATPRG